MTPLDLMTGRRAPLRLVIFDCDGVIVDSEPVANRLVAEALTRLGWSMTPADADRHFLGMTLTDMVPVIEARLGQRLPDGWKQGLMSTMVDTLGREATAIAGAVEALRAVSALGLPWRVASNSSHEEMRAKFACLGISDLVAGRVHSHRDVGRGKPEPDLFLAAAAAEGIPPAACVVIEDSLPGARAAAAAAMDCLGYAPHSDGSHLRAAGAVPFRSMFDLPGLIAAANGVAA
ncbi:HAD family hydrolase [Limobrevibacterium gyesilva]|uniref:HAD-IA family hydrolase n=1 Tax=Limobrevibacterium gyesilva TaxID=2991712 RepID=A0AA41YKM9_9PROT|nr:HAD-IA family hydrolase [Limobrevibacterium gyesilva]MCW3473623.1 HAD-IA family hydrolase [Limobrevibacterium gyesilva]